MKKKLFCSLCLWQQFKFIKQSYFLPKMKVLSKKRLQPKTFKCPFLTKAKHTKKHLQKTAKFGTFLELVLFMFMLENLERS